MALFVFGAGATRGCSFVDATKFPCIPPLDRDFFTQLQRVSNPKHHALVKAVMVDVVEMFGSNFDVTMETVFTTLEHTIKMLKTTGESRDFKANELQQKRDRLKQAVAVVLEESLTAGLTAKTCAHHEQFVAKILQPRDAIISFNYDCVLDDSLHAKGNFKWNSHYGYGFNLGPGGKRFLGHEHWQPQQPSPKEETAKLYKLHGSLHFLISGTDEQPRIRLKQRPYTKQAGGGVRFSIIPPEWHKQFDKGAFATLWSKASMAINEARHIVLIGYSLPATDLHSTALFRTSVKKGALESLIVVNPDRETRWRIRSVLQRGLSPHTKVLSFDYFPEFLAADKSLWAP